MAEQEERKILGKFEWILLIVALGILAMVVLQNNGIYMVETTEEIELTNKERKAQKEAKTQPEANTLFEKKNLKKND